MRPTHALAAALPLGKHYPDDAGAHFKVGLTVNGAGLRAIVREECRKSIYTALFSEQGYHLLNAMLCQAIDTSPERQAEAQQKRRAEELVRSAEQQRAWEAERAKRKEALLVRWPAIKREYDAIRSKARKARTGEDIVRLLEMERDLDEARSFGLMPRGAGRIVPRRR